MAAFIDKEENFNFKPKTFFLTRIHRVQIFKELSLDVVLAPRSLVLATAHFFLGVLWPPTYFRSNWSPGKGRRYTISVR